jgi:hypothetical protein
MNLRMTSLPIFALIGVLSIRASTSAPLSGVYSITKNEPVLQFDNDGTRKEIGRTQNTYSIEWSEDGTLRVATSTTYGAGSKTYYRGVWQQDGDRIYFIAENVTAAGARMPTAQSWLGSERLSFKGDVLTVDGVIGAPLLLERTYRRVATADLGAKEQAADLASLKTTLAKIVRSVCRPAYAGVESEAELTALVHRAAAAGDVQALMRVSYPTLAGVEDDPALNYYLEYMNALALPGTVKVDELPRREIEKQLAAMKKQGAGFADSMTPQGAFAIGRSWSKGSSASQWFFYGVVDGKWAIFGSPYHLKAVEEKRRSQPTSPKR